MMPKHVIAGPDSINEIVKLVKSFGADKVLMVTDKGVWNTGLVDKPIKLLTEAGIGVEVINDVPPEPEIKQVEELVKRARDFRCDMVISIGGGSAMDTAKIIAALMVGKKSIKEIMEAAETIEKGLPTLMIATTAGTGSEATPNAIVTIPEQGLKVGIVSRNFMADYVILDPMLTVKLPPAITASTGIDALAHAIECFISKKANPFSDMLALTAIRLICSSIKTAYTTGENLQARHNMILGSFYGGMCIASSGTTAVHALSYPLGGRYKIPHGVSNAMLLAHVMEFNKDLIVDKLSRVAFEMEIEVGAASKDEVADKVIEGLHSLVRELNIPSDLRQYGVGKKDIDTLVEEASKVTRLLDNNPKVLSRNDMEKIYKKLF
ncbi:MAG: alcohol dehydrogenase [Clostridia bacterium BRH_c25]|nr:MAG: alcohol dehydrogenase [Clostridia bacterium BRH_c25]